MSVLRELRCIVIADMLIESGDQHKRIVQIFADLFAVEFDAADAVIDEAVAGIVDEADAVEEVVDHHGLEDVQLKIALRAGETDSRVVAHNLNGDHRHRFGLGRIDLSGHDRRAGLVLRQRDLAEATTRARGEPANVVCDLHQTCGECFQRTGGKNNFVMSAQCSKLIWVRFEWQAS